MKILLIAGVVVAIIAVVAAIGPRRIQFRHEFGFWPANRTPETEQRILTQLRALDDAYRQGGLNFLGAVMTGGKARDEGAPTLSEALAARERYRRDCILAHSFGYTELCSIPEEL